MTATTGADCADIPDVTLRDRHGLEVLSGGECSALLRRASVGRIGLCESGLPVVLTVNFVVEDDGILVRTGTGSLLRAAAARAVVVLEVDGHDSAGVAWSVVVRGMATEKPRPGELAAGLPCWGRSSANRVVEIRGHEISGRRVAPTDHPEPRRDGWGHP